MQQDLGRHDWRAFWVMVALRIGYVGILPAIVLTAIAFPGISSMLHDSPVALLIGISSFWWGVAVALGLRPLWDGDYRLDRPYGQSALQIVAWLGGAVAVSYLFIFFLVLLIPSMLIAAAIFAVARLLARRAVRRAPEH